MRFRTCVKISFFLFAFIFLSSNQVQSQNLGLSFSYLIPTSGDFSNPVSPFSLRGYGFELTRNIVVESGFSLYRIGGMNVRDIPIDPDRSLAGPFFSIYVPLELYFRFATPIGVVKFGGGGFGYINFANKINEGVFDRAYAAWKNYQLVNSQVEISEKPGYGFLLSFNLEIPIQRNLELTLGTSYLQGGSSVNISGEVDYYDGNSFGSEQLADDFSDATLDYRGFEVSAGIIFSGRR